MKTITEILKERPDIDMDEWNFWMMVHSVNWKKISLGKYQSEEIQKRILSSLSYKTLVDLRAIYAIAHNMLDELIGDRNPANGGDDSHGDLISHIVGLGRDVFYAHLADYSLIEARGNAPYQTVAGYREKFAYCLPYVQDHPDHKGKKEIEYDVTIEATVRKTIKVRADSEDKAIELGHELFTTERDKDEEKYDEYLVSCNKTT